MFQLFGIVNCFVHVNKTPKFIPLSHLFVILPYLNSNPYFFFRNYRDGEVAFDVNERMADKIVGFMKE